MSEMIIDAFPGLRFSRALLLIGLVLIVPFASPRAEQANEPVDLQIRKSVVLIRVSSILYSQTRPWVREAGSPRTVMGLVVPGKGIIALASDIRKPGLIEVTKYSSYNPTIARVVELDVQANLALLEVEDDSFFEDLVPIPAGIDPAVGREVSAVQVDELFRVYRERVQVTEHRTAADFGLTVLPVSVFRSAQSFSSGGVLLCGDRICGLVAYSDGDRRNEAIMPTVLDAFRQRVALPDGYTGFVAQGIQLQNLVDPALRNHFGLPETESGALIARVFPGTSAYGSLRPNDILLTVEGTNIDNRGFFEADDQERKSLNLLIARDGDRLRHPGEKLSLRVFRAGRVREIEMELRAYDGGAERVPWLSFEQPNYIVESGIVMLELSVQLLRQVYGSDWREKAGRLSFLYQTERYYEKAGEDDRIVVIAGVLPSPYTLGYEDLGILPVHSLNDTPVVNLKQLHEELERLETEGTVVGRLTLAGGQQVFLNVRDRSDINKQVLERYGIPAASTWDDASNP